MWAHHLLAMGSGQCPCSCIATKPRGWVLLFFVCPLFSPATELRDGWGQEWRRERQVEKQWCLSRGLWPDPTLTSWWVQSSWHTWSSGRNVLTCQWVQGVHDAWGAQPKEGCNYTAAPPPFHPLPHSPLVGRYFFKFVVSVLYYLLTLATSA